MQLESRKSMSKQVILDHKQLPKEKALWGEWGKQGLSSILKNKKMKEEIDLLKSVKNSEGEREPNPNI